ncbi:MAG: thiamine phosphate synthase [Acidobacteriota bacterium]
MSTFISILEKRRLAPPLLYGISDRKGSPSCSNVLEYLRILFRTRAHILQWREKDLTAEEQRGLVRAGADLARQTGKLFLVNTWVKIALKERADGAHLPSSQSLIEACKLRSAAGHEDDFVLGKSVHSAREALEAEREGADYLLLGPVFDPISKESVVPPLGLSGLRETAQMLSLPVIALGGVEETTLARILSTSVVGAAGISWMQREVEQLTGR